MRRRPSPSGRCSIGGPCRGWHRRSWIEPARARCLRRHGRGPLGSRRSSTTCRTGTCAGRAAGSGTRQARAVTTRARRSTRSTSASRRWRRCWRPFTPFIAEALWRNLAARRDGGTRLGAPRRLPRIRRLPTRRGSRCAPWRPPAAIVGLGRTVRDETKTRVRQPLSEAVVHYAGDHERARTAPGQRGRRAERQAGRVRRDRGRARSLARQAQLPGAGAERSARGSSRSRRRWVPTTARSPRRSPEERMSRSRAGRAGDARAGRRATWCRRSGEGWGVASDGGPHGGAGSDLTDELRREGVARELIRAVQDARKAAGLEVADRIELGLRSGRVATAL